ncbi:MAG: response regulator [Bryobacteraceae bacterium]|nr:response regulator [Bryobacteraceae bacterium]
MGSASRPQAPTIDRDLSRRAMYGGAVYLGFVAALAIATDYARIGPATMGLVTACSVVCAVGRWLLAVRFDGIYGYSRRLWRSLLWGTVLLTAGAWGVFLAASVLRFGYYDSKTLILLVCLAGTAPVAHTSFAPALPLSFAYQHLLVVPIIAANLYLGDVRHYALAVLFSWYLLFMLIYARRLHVEYRESLERTEMLLARRAAEEANRAKSELLAYISHEIRGPMNAISGMTYLALNTAKDPQQRQYLEIVHESSRFLERLLSELLDVSKMDAGGRDLERAPLDLHRLVEGVAASYRATAKRKGLSLRTQIAAGTPRFVKGDAGALRQVLQNVVHNAVRFTRTGSIEISVRGAESGDAAEMVHFAVADTGAGIALHRQRAIFEPFQQADASVARRHGGTGLGLAISSRLVRLMGGDISVESKPGAGSVFRWSTRLEGAELAAPKPLPGPPEKGARILVADDEPVSLLVAARLLESRGHVVRTATNGCEVLEALKQAPFELILMDLNMPEMDGLEAASRIRSLEGGGALPIIALTASVADGVREECLSAGMNDFLAKPIDPDELYRLVERYAAAPSV